MKRTRQIEVYYGFFAGDAQIWDTDYVEIPSDTPEEAVDQTAIAAFFADPPPCGVAFAGVYNKGGEEEGTEGQDRESYSDDQARDSYT